MAISREPKYCLKLSHVSLNLEVYISISSIFHASALGMHFTGHIVMSTCRFLYQKLCILMINQQNTSQLQSYHHYNILPQCTIGILYSQSHSSLGIYCM